MIGYWIARFLIVYLLEVALNLVLRMLGLASLPVGLGAVLGIALAVAELRGKRWTHGHDR